MDLCIVWAALKAGSIKHISYLDCWPDGTPKHFELCPIRLKLLPPKAPKPKPPPKLVPKRRVTVSQSSESRSLHFPPTPASFVVESSEEEAVDFPNLDLKPFFWLRDFPEERAPGY